MKRVVVAVIVLVFIVTGGILENIYVTKTFRELENKLISLEQAVLAEDETALDQLRDISEWWEKRRMYIELLPTHPTSEHFPLQWARRKVRSNAVIIKTPLPSATPSLLWQTT